MGVPRVQISNPSLFPRGIRLEVKMERGSMEGFAPSLGWVRTPGSPPPSTSRGSWWICGEHIAVLVAPRGRTRWEKHSQGSCGAGLRCIRLSSGPAVQRSLRLGNTFEERAIERH